MTVCPNSLLEEKIKKLEVELENANDLLSAARQRGKYLVLLFQDEILK